MENEFVLSISKEITRMSITDYREYPNMKRMNTAIAVTFTDTHVVVTTSGKDKGYIALWKHDNFSKYSFIESRIVNNKNISGHIMANLNPVFEAEIQKAVEEMKQNFHSAPKWKYTNCAEPHAITVCGRSEEIFGEYVGELKYMAVFKINHETMQFEEFERCAYCKITTSNKYHPYLIVLTDSC